MMPAPRVAVPVVAGCTPDWPGKESGTDLGDPADSGDSADAGNHDDSGCVAERPGEPWSETENYHRRSCAMCDSVWVCGGLG